MRNDINFTRGPKVHPTYKTGRAGLGAARSIIEATANPCFEVPQEGDFGIDLFVQFADEASPSEDRAGGRSPYIERWIQKVTSEGMTGDRIVTGRMLGLQVKTRTKFKPKKELWSFSTKEEHRVFWSNCPFPVILVGSSPDGKHLRWTNVTEELRQNPEMKTFHLREEFTPKVVEDLRKTGVEEAVIETARDWVLDLFLDTEDGQLDAIRACYALWPKELRVVRILASRLPSLHIEPMIYGLQLVFAFEELLESVADEISDQELEDIDKYLHPPVFGEWSDRQLLRLAAEFTQSETFHSRMEFVKGRNDEVHIAPQDYFEGDGALNDRANASANYLSNYAPLGRNDCIIEIFSRQEDVTGTILRIADSISTNILATLLIRTLVRAEQREGTFLVPIEKCRSAFKELLKAYPFLQSNANFLDDLEIYKSEFGVLLS